MKSCLLTRVSANSLFRSNKFRLRTIWPHFSPFSNHISDTKAQTKMLQGYSVSYTLLSDHKNNIKYVHYIIILNLFNVDFVNEFAIMVFECQIVDRLPILPQQINYFWLHLGIYFRRCMSRGCCIFVFPDS